MKDTCERFQVLINGRIDNELTPKQEEELNSHISSCGSCADTHKELTGLAQDLDGMSLGFEPTDVWSRVKDEMAADRAEVLPGAVFPVILVMVMVIYKVLDMSMDFRIAFLLKPVIVAVAVVLLGLKKSNPFRVCEELNIKEFGFE